MELPQAVMQEKTSTNGREEITFVSYFVLPAVKHSKNVFSD
jgi:hypothetical protein